MPARFALIEGAQPLLPENGPNCRLPETPELQQLRAWTRAGKVLVASTVKTDRIVPTPVPGIRSDTRGVLKVDSTPEIRGTRCAEKAIFDATFYLPTLDETHAIGRFRGHASSRPQRYGGRSDDSPPALDLFASKILIEAVKVQEDRNPNEQTYIYCLAPTASSQAHEDEAKAKGFDEVKGGIALYSRVETEILGSLVVTSEMLGLGFMTHYTDPIEDPDIADFNWNAHIRMPEIAELWPDRYVLPTEN